MLTHLECNPQMLGKISNQGGLRFHEWKVQMGLPQGDLLSLQKNYPSPSELAFSTSSVRYAPTTASTLFDCSTVQRRKKSRPKPARVVGPPTGRKSSCL